MIYRFGISTPANTAESDKKKTVLQVTRGIVHQIDIQFPSGPSGLLHLAINDALHQLWPYNTDGSFAANNVNIRFKEFITLLEEPYQLEAYTWNLDTDYEHSVIIRLGILPSHIIAPWLMTYEERLEAILGGP